MPWAASPPRHFCHDQVITSSRSQGIGHGVDRAGRVAEGQALAVGGRGGVVGHLHAAGGAVPGEDHVGVPVDGLEVGDLAVVGPHHLGVELELLGDVGDPALAEAFPGHGGYRPGPEQAPHGASNAPVSLAGMMPSR